MPLLVPLLAGMRQGAVQIPFPGTIGRAREGVVDLRRCRLAFVAHLGRSLVILMIEFVRQKKCLRC